MVAPRVPASEAASADMHFFKDFIYLFMRDREREGERERSRDTGRGRSRLHAGSLMWDSIPVLQDQALG